MKIIFSFVNGLMPSRAFVAGFFTTFSFSRPGSVNRPPLRRLFLIWPLSDSNTAATCLRDSSASLQIVSHDFRLRRCATFLCHYSTPRWKKCREKKLSAASDSARNISHAFARANEFSCTRMLQMPCFLGSGAHARRRGECASERTARVLAVRIFAIRDARPRRFDVATKSLKWLSRRVPQRATRVQVRQQAQQHADARAMPTDGDRSMPPIGGIDAAKRPQQRFADRRRAAP